MKRRMRYNTFILKEQKMSNSQYKMVRRDLSEQKILINLNKSMVYDIIYYLLITYFNLNIVGYNKNMNEFYGKKIKKGFCVLQLNFKIIESTNTNTTITITPVIGTCQDIDKFIEIFNKKIYTYL